LRGRGEKGRGETTERGRIEWYEEFLLGVVPIGSILSRQEGDSTYNHHYSNATAQQRTANNTGIPIDPVSARRVYSYNYQHGNRLSY
jgi:hypothetical protein